jgi:dinuclear metal center YbgI/SA1388 family protein
MIIKEIIQHFESIAPPDLQESYDNCGLIVGDANLKANGVLFSLDCTEAVVDEAISLGFNLIVAHHPIVFSGLKKINGKNYVERTVIKAIKHDIAIYAAHTNYDNIKTGVNAMIADKLGLLHQRILSPKSNTLKKIATYVPHNHASVVMQALAEAGAGSIGNYSHCSFQTTGTGTFKANEQANPHVGKKGELHQEAETKIEMVFPHFLEGRVLEALHQSHPYEEVAYDIFGLTDQSKEYGSGMIGELPEEMNETDFMQLLKDKFHVPTIKHTALLNKPIRKVALCGGSGSFLLKNALSAQADVYLSADFKYHEFFDAEGRILITDIGHYETEQFTPQLFYNHFVKYFSTFAARLSKVHTNPVNYF